MKLNKMDLYTLMEIVEKLKIANEDSDILTCFVPLSRLIPFNAILACKYNRIEKNPNLERFVSSGFENNFLAEYSGKALYLEDPVLKFCTKNIFPCTWNQVRDMSRGTNQRLMLCELIRDYGYNDGVSFAINEFGLRKITYLAISTDTSVEISNQLALVTTVTPFIHFAFNSTLETRDSNKSDSGLTTREKEVFKWIAEGKTQWEISKILSVSERTIRFHVTNVTRKLNATNCTHAVVKLISENILY